MKLPLSELPKSEALPELPEWNYKLPKSVLRFLDRVAMARLDREIEKDAERFGAYVKECELLRNLKRKKFRKNSERI